VSSGDPLQPDEPERPGEVRGPVSVVLADDQALMRMGFRMVLEAEEDITVVGEASDGTSALAPSLDTSGLAGSIRFFDARVDDARLVIDLVRTAVGLGALAANRTKVTGFLTDERGHVHGARVTDLATGTDHEIRAKRTINAAGVWTEDVQDLATDAGGLKVLASKGIHIVVPKEAIDAETGVFLRTEKSVLFIIPWPEYWVIGTTDTPWDLDVSKPVATAADVDYILEHANSVLSRPITREDIIGVYAGLRPLLQPKLKPGAEAASTKVSREHTVTRIAPGLTAIAGGKLTTYRVMASDAVDHALGEALSHAHPCATQELPLVGAAGYHAPAQGGRGGPGGRRRDGARRGGGGAATRPHRAAPSWSTAPPTPGAGAVHRHGRPGRPSADDGDGGRCPGTVRPVRPGGRRVRSPHGAPLRGAATAAQRAGRCPLGRGGRPGAPLRPGLRTGGRSHR